MCLQITANKTEVAAVPGTHRPAAANGAGSDCQAPCGLSRIYGRRQLRLQRHRAVNQDASRVAFHLPYHKGHPALVIPDSRSTASQLNKNRTCSAVRFVSSVPNPLFLSLGQQEQSQKLGRVNCALHAGQTQGSPICLVFMCFFPHELIGTKNELSSYRCCRASYTPVEARRSVELRTSRPAIERHSNAEWVVTEGCEEE